MNNFFIVNNPDKLKNCLQWITSVCNQHHWVKVTVSVEKRSLSKNALSHTWYNEIAGQLGEMTNAEVKAFCKLTFGVPILRQNEKFDKFYSMFFSKLSYQKQLAAMKYLSITSIMDNAQMTNYMNNVSAHFTNRSVILTAVRDF